MVAIKRKGKAVLIFGKKGKVKEKGGLEIEVVGLSLVSRGKEAGFGGRVSQGSQCRVFYTTFA